MSRLLQDKKSSTFSCFDLQYLGKSSLCMRLPLWIRLTTSWYVIKCHHVKLKDFSWRLIISWCRGCKPNFSNCFFAWLMKNLSIQHGDISWWYLVTFRDIWLYFGTKPYCLSWYVMTNHEMTPWFHFWQVSLNWI